MIEVTENDDKTFTISWDENDPQESIFNNFKEEDFINLIQNYLQSLQESGEVDINQVTEAVNHINDHIEEEIINICEETYGKECYEGAEHEDYYNKIKDPDNWYEAKAQAIEEYLRDQDTELKEDRTLPPPDNFPLFP